MKLWLNTAIDSSIRTPPFNLAPFKSLTNCKDFPRSFKWGVESRFMHLVHKFDKQFMGATILNKDP